MAVGTTTYNLNFTSNGDQVFNSIDQGFQDIRRSTEAATKSFGDSFKSLLSFSLALEGIESLKTSLDELIQPGIDLNTQMADLSAITGQVGEGLDKIEKSARQSAKTFGTDATQNIESYKLLLSKLSPEIAENDKALGAMGTNVNILSKTMGGDTVAATNVLTTAMNQFDVALDDPIAASKIMGDMMNVMSAGAKEGPAELPEIASALEQAGMMAKNANVSFVETNAAIQLLDKAGKKGSEGGVALRNVLATLSQGRFLPKTIREELQGAGVDITKLADLSIPLTERMKELKPIMSDSALITKLFGKENSAAAVALLNGIPAIEELKEKMTGTNTAVEQAEIVMGSYAEKMKRTKSVFTDLKISVFKATEAFMPYISTTMTIAASLGSLAVSINAVKTLYSSFKLEIWKNIKALWAKVFVTNADTSATNRNTVSMSIGGKIAHWYRTKIFTINTQMFIGAVASTIFSKAIGLIKTAMIRATIATYSFSAAIMAIPVIGWIIAGVTAVVVGFKLLWDNSRKFRQVLFGTWEAAKTVFSNIGIVASRIYNMVLKPIVEGIWKTVKTVFSKVWGFVKGVWNGIGEGLSFLWNDIISPVLSFFRTGFEFVFGNIIGFASQAWGYITSVFSGFTSFISDNIISPIKDVFSNIWGWITGLLDKIFSKLTGFLAPIRKLWNSIFSSDGLGDVGESYEKGAKKGGESYDKDQKEKEEEEKKEDPPIDYKSIFDVANPKLPKVAPIGGVAEKEKNKNGGKGSRVSSLNITKLVETINIHNHNGSTMSKTKIVGVVKEALLTASADYTALN